MCPQAELFKAVRIRAFLFIEETIVITIGNAVASVKKKMSLNPFFFRLADKLLYSSPAGFGYRVGIADTAGELTIIQFVNTKKLSVQVLAVGIDQAVFPDIRPFYIVTVEYIYYPGSKSFHVFHSLKYYYPYIFTVPA
ncbi:hypothetical protein [uncultured Dysgonomonas sp.]|uniref:hypothetical protein n=1 Tax=uncultured Dysgonomonas sp. TaxID=206096 RepID=UPI002804ABF3|nr:hypothetical protein [uncultured Dysgonomonas sp.]